MNLKDIENTICIFERAFPKYIKMCKVMGIFYEVKIDKGSVYVLGLNKSNIFYYITDDINSFNEEDTEVIINNSHTNNDIIDSISVGGNRIWADIDEEFENSEIKVVGGRNLISVKGMFRNLKCKSIDFSGFCTSKLKSFENMFISSSTGNIKFNTLYSHHITDFSYMFRGAVVEGELRFSELDTTNAINMSGMFENAIIPKANFDGFYTSNVKYMNCMFLETDWDKLKLNIDTHNVISMQSMFHNCSLEDDFDIHSFDVSKVQDMSYMFSRFYCKVLDLSNARAVNCTDMSYMFENSGCDKLILNNFCTKNVVNMRGMFLGYSRTELDVSSFNTLKVTDMSQMFLNVRNIEDRIVGLEQFDTSNVENMAAMFMNAKVGTFIQNFNTSKVTNMSDMFKYFVILNDNIFDVSNFDFSSVADMSFMFFGCKIKCNILKISDFDMNNKNMENAFGLQLGTLKVTKDNFLLDVKSLLHEKLYYYIDCSNPEIVNKAKSDIRKVCKTHELIFDNNIIEELKVQ